MSTFPPSGKAFPRFEAAEIDLMLENHELPDKLVKWLELALSAAKTGDEDEVAVGFFIKHAEDEELEVEDEDDAED